MIGDRILPGLLSKENLERAIGAAVEGDRNQDYRINYPFS